MSLVLLLLGLLLFVGLVVVHEFGHFIMARRGGVEVEEFGIGFPPRAWKKRIKSPKGNFNFTLNWLPLGGFVKLKGENDADKRPGSFGAASLGIKIKIMLAGVVMNLLTAFVLLTVLAATGMPRLLEDQFTVRQDTKVIKQDVLVGLVEENSPAARAGIQTRDQLISVKRYDQSLPVFSASVLPDITKRFEGETVELIIKRGNKLINVPVTFRTRQEVEANKNTDHPKGYLGVVPTEYTIQRSTWSAPIVAAGFMRQATALTFRGLGSALANLFRGDTGKASSQVAGPVGIFVILKDGSLLGYQFILMIIAVISLTLAIMNVLPVPALDGGRLFITLLFRVARKPLRKKTEELIHGAGFAVLMLLFVLITIVDVKRFF